MPLRLTLEIIPRGDERRKRVVGTLDIENTGDHPDHPRLAHYHFCMKGPVHGGGIDYWHEGIIHDVERAKGYWQHVKEVLNAVDCESQPMDDV